MKTKSVAECFSFVPQYCDTCRTLNDSFNRTERISLCLFLYVCVGVCLLRGGLESSAVFFFSICG